MEDERVEDDLQEEEDELLKEEKAAMVCTVKDDANVGKDKLKELFDGGRDELGEGW